MGCFPDKIERYIDNMGTPPFEKQTGKSRFPQKAFQRRRNNILLDSKADDSSGNVPGRGRPSS
jgi:hypothetical protein